MRLLAGIMGALVAVVVAGASAAVPPPSDIESSSTNYELHIEQDNAWCGTDCLMNLTMEAGNYTAQGPTTIDVAIVDLASGPTIAVGDVYADNGDNFAWTSAIGFQDGHNYVATMDWATPAPPGGVTTSFTITWKFQFRSGGAPQTVAPWIAPQTSFDRVKVKPGKVVKKVRFRVVSGRVLARTEQSDFTLNSLHPQGGRKVVIQRLAGSRWLTVKKTTTSTVGRFSVKVRAPKAKASWRVVVSGTAGSPAATLAIPGRA